MQVSDLFIYPLKSARGIAKTSSEVDAFVLYSSHLSPNGSLYRAEQSYRLRN